MPILSDSVPRLGLRPERVADEHVGRNQQATQRVYAGDPGFGLLTSGFYILKGYQGRSPERSPWLRRGSKWKGIGSLNRSLGKSACRGLRRKLDSPGTKVLGTRSTAEMPSVT